MVASQNSYTGGSRKLVVAFDIGTTFSGAAYALLDPGEVPKIQSVTRKVLPAISRRETMVTSEKQVLEYPELWICESPLCAVLRPRRQLLWH